MISWILQNEKLKKFEVQTKQVNFEILRLRTLLSNLGVMQNMISPTLSKLPTYDKKHKEFQELNFYLLNKRKRRASFRPSSVNGHGFIHTMLQDQQVNA